MRCNNWYSSCITYGMNMITHQGGLMSRKPIEILHELMTSQIFILAVAIVLFLLMITLADPGRSEAVIGQLWT
jgi:ABC-type polysaccharide/polyol phosphate export permease